MPLGSTRNGGLYAKPLPPEIFPAPPAAAMIVGPSIISRFKKMSGVFDGPTNG